MSTPTSKELKDFMVAHFDHPALKELCFDHGFLKTIGREINFDRGDLTLIALDIAQYCEKQVELPALAKALRLANRTAYKQTFGGNDDPTDTPDERDALAHHRAEVVAAWSQPRYQLDTQFVNLTLTVDNGEDADERYREDTRRFSELREAWQHNPAASALMVLGKPGSGKSTLLRRLQLDEAHNPANAQQISFFVAFNTYPTEFDQKPPTPLAWLAARWRAAMPPNLPSFEDALKENRVLLLLDGLNEIPHADADGFDKLLKQWRSFLMQHFAPTGHASMRNRAVFSCRELNYGGGGLSSDAAPVQIVNVNPLSPQQVRAFLDAKIATHAQAVWEQLSSDPRVFELYQTPIYLELLLEQCKRNDWTVPKNKAQLFTRFVQQAFFEELEKNPQGILKSPLLDPDDRRLITQRKLAALELPDGGCLIPALTHLAFALQRHRAEGSQAHVAEDEKRVRALLIAEFPNANPQDILNAGFQLKILDKDQRSVKYFHQLLQEFFAARQLVHATQDTEFDLMRQEWRADAVSPNLRQRIASVKRGEPLGLLPATRWEDTAQIAASLCRTPAQADAFARRIAERHLPLAARCAAGAGVPVSDALKHDLRLALVQRTRDPAADLRARIDAGLALGELGDDPRFATHTNPSSTRYLLPPFITIPAGDHVIGHTDGTAYEAPPHPVPLAAFGIAQYPVTNAEYACFVKAGGYTDERWWNTPAALAWLRNEGGAEPTKQRYRDTRQLLLDNGFDEARIQQMVEDDESAEDLGEIYSLWLRFKPAEFEEWLTENVAAQAHAGVPNFWEDPRFNNPAQPVVGVCWHEARAYCNWLSHAHRHAFRLPSEAEWEAAARFVPTKRGQQKDRGSYAYAGAFDPTKANTLETRIRRTTPVGVFPEGMSGTGIDDMSGNVYEWTLSAWGKAANQPEYVYPYTEWRNEREDVFFADDVARVVRGGSWNSLNNLARCADRDDLSPNVRNYSYGFRLLSLLSPSY